MEGARFTTVSRCNTIPPSCGALTVNAYRPTGQPDPIALGGSRPGPQRLDLSRWKFFGLAHKIQVVRPQDAEALALRPELPARPLLEECCIENLIEFGIQELKGHYLGGRRHKGGPVACTIPSDGGLVQLCPLAVVVIGRLDPSDIDDAAIKFLQRTQDLLGGCEALFSRSFVAGAAVLDEGRHVCDESAYKHADEPDQSGERFWRHGSNSIAAAAPEASARWSTVFRPRRDWRWRE